jgi:hypothetical protein
MAPNHVLFFPHERVTFDAVHDLNVRSKSRRRLQGLLAAASTVVQHQAASLDGLERADIGFFEDLVELAERQATQTRGSIVADLVLLTTVQIGQLLVYVSLTRQFLKPLSDVIIPIASPKTIQRSYPDMEGQGQFPWDSASGWWLLVWLLAPRQPMGLSNWAWRLSRWPFVWG